MSETLANSGEQVPGEKESKAAKNLLTLEGKKSRSLHMEFLIFSCFSSCDYQTKPIGTWIETWRLSTISAVLYKTNSSHSKSVIVCAKFRNKESFSVPPEGGVFSDGFREQETH